MYKGFVTFEEVLEDQLRDPEFRKEWEDGEADYQVSRQMIKARLEKKMSQRALAKKVKTSQARISQLENMNGNPSLSFLRRVSSALDIKFQLSV
jgi:ribosome-binding protein aMBF1 (putative translation factor)